MQNSVADMTPFLPQLSLEERDRRWRAIREEMIMQGLDCLLIWANDICFGMGEAYFRYVTHIGPQRLGGICIFPLVGEPVVFAAAPHMHDHPYPVYDSYQHWIKVTRAFSGIEPVIRELRKLGYERGIIGWASFVGVFAEALPYHQFTSLLKQLDRATFEKATPLLDKVRAIKSAEEIQFLEKAGAIARKKIDAMIEFAKPGNKECELYARMIEEGIANGEEAYIFNLLTSGSVTEEHTQHMLHGKGPPLAPTTRSLQKGDIILTEFHTSYGGYLAATEKTLFLGEPPEELDRLHAVAVESLASGIGAMKAGATLGDVWSSFYRPVKDAGMDYLELGFHGHGMTSPEYPTYIRQPRTEAEQLLLEAKGMADMQLRENMALGINVDIYDPKWRTDIGVVLGDTVVITKNAARKLVGTPLELVASR